MVQSGYGRPPVLDRLITIDGNQVWAARRDFTARDTVETGQPFSQISLSYVRFIVRAGILLTLGDCFADDNGIERRIEGVSEIGRGQFLEILGRTTSFTPVGVPDPPVDPVDPVTPMGMAYRWAGRPFSGQPGDGEYRIADFNGTNIYVSSTDSDGQTFAGFEVGKVMMLEFTNGLMATATVTEIFTWSGFGGQSAGPACFVTPDVDLEAIGDRTVGLTITIPN